MDNTRPPWVTHASSPPCRPHTPWYDGLEPMRLRHHSAGSTIVHLWPTGSSLGSPLRLRPGGSPQALQTPPHGGRPALRSSFASASEALPPLLDIDPGPRVEWDFNPPETCAARHTLRAAPPLCAASVLSRLWGLHLRFSLYISTTGSHVPHKSLDQGHAAFMPSTTQAVNRLPLSLSRSTASPRF